MFTSSQLMWLETWVAELGVWLKFSHNNVTGLWGSPGRTLKLTNTIASVPLSIWVVFSISDSQEDCSQLSSHLSGKGRSREERRVGGTMQKWFFITTFYAG